MIHVFSGILIESWGILKEASPYVLFGFFAAGVLKALIPENLVARHLGGKGFLPVFKASLFGVPLPLCSCGVIPVAVGLRQQGASKGATASFLISVPETGIDSIAITWALLDPLMTVIRPVAAFITAMVTGVAINLLPERQPTSVGNGKRTCRCSRQENEDVDIRPQQPLFKRLKDGLTYAFSDLLKDIGGWLLLGIVMAGIISYFVPVNFVERYLGGEVSSLWIMLVVGIPLYICASASTPIAAALVLKGLSPGAALVFLLAGPATNAATMTVVAKHLGRAATAVYVSVIAVSSLFIGWTVNRIYGWFSVDILNWVGPFEGAAESGLYLWSSIVLLTLLAWSCVRPQKSGKCACGCQSGPGS
jgi:hypothetical protein